MAKTRPFSLSDLHLIDGGKIHRQWIAMMAGLIRDINDRPGEMKEREITLKMLLRPVLDKDTGVLDDVKFRFDLRSKAPAATSLEYAGLPTDDGHLMHNPDSPHDARQGVFDFYRGGEDAAGEPDEADGVTPPDDDDEHAAQ